MKTKKVIGILLSVTISLLLLLATGCNRENTEKASGGADKKLIVGVTIVPQQTFVEAVCGELAEVVTMIPPGNSHENYEPTPKQIEKFSDASVYFTIGVPSEEAKILPILGNVKAVSLQNKVAAVYADRTFDIGERDPHIWLSPKRVKVMIDTIAKEMSTLDPNNEKTYTENAKAYNEQLDALDTQIKAALEGVQNKKFVVFHPAFGYLADDYGLTMYSLEEEGKEATPQHLQEMIDLAKKEKIKAIFYQEEIDSNQSKAFAEELGGKTIQLAPLAADYIVNLKSMAETMAEVMQ